MGKCITEVFTRVTGFFRPVQTFNPGKQKEVEERAKFDKSVKEVGSCDAPDVEKKQ